MALFLTASNFKAHSFIEGVSAKACVEIESTASDATAMRLHERMIELTMASVWMELMDAIKRPSIYYIMLNYKSLAMPACILHHCVAGQEGAFDREKFEATFSQSLVT
ncbi:MAG: hypothetical protein M9924_09935 [Rhizobiaceae bacterium]|nr:hypothetical protein [Rhizobiaceae bacterium]